VYCLIVADTTPVVFSDMIGASPCLLASKREIVQRLSESNNNDSKDELDDALGKSGRPASFVVSTCMMGS
jgi:hypothetical protein